MSQAESRICVVCEACENHDGGLLQICGRCKAVSYCCKDHQKADWSSHKKWCHVRPAQKSAMKTRWWGKERKCRRCHTTHAYKRSCHFDNCPTAPENHYGVPELIIWPFRNEYGVETGWGNIAKKKSAALKKRFEGELGGDEEKLANIRPEAFRWSCCGATMDVPYQCDHHGSGPRPCSCDFCTGGRPLPPAARKMTVGRYGLKLSHGPDPRSFNPALGGFNLAMNKLFMGNLDKT